MIIKTKWSAGGGKSALSIAKYIERGIKKNDERNRLYRTLYYGSHPANKEDLKEYAKYADRIKGRKWASVRHIIIAPERNLDERELHYKVMRVMERWIQKSGNYGVRYVWGMHYNTEHPHAHIAIVSSYPEDIVMEREDLRELKKIVSKVFEEEMGVKNKELDKEMDKELKEAEKEEVEEMEMGA